MDKDGNLILVSIAGGIHYLSLAYLFVVSFVPLAINLVICIRQHPVSNGLELVSALQQFRR